MGDSGHVKGKKKLQRASEQKFYFQAQGGPGLLTHPQGFDLVGKVGAGLDIKADGGVRPCLVQWGVGTPPRVQWRGQGDQFPARRKAQG